MADFRMPSLGADMDEGTVVEWLVQPGQVVRKGDIVAVVDTEKSAIEVETFDSGTVTEIVVPVGQKVPVGAVLARLSAEEVPEEAPEAVPGPRAAPAGPPAPTVRVGPLVPTVRRPPAPAVSPAPAPPPEHVRVTSPLVRHVLERKGMDAAELHGTGVGGRLTRADLATARAGPPGAERPRVTPYARRLAAELGVDLATVPAGPDGAVGAREVRRAAESAAPVPAAATVPAAAPTPAAPAVTPAPSEVAHADHVDHAERMRRAIAERMSRSNAEIPHYYLSTTVDMSAATKWLQERNRGRGMRDRLVPAALLLKAVALALRQVPGLNGYWVDEHLVAEQQVRLGVAVALRGGGLVVPAIADADRMPVEDLMAHLRELVERARRGRMRGSDLAEPTITVTDLGERGVESVMGVIYPPQVALVGLGRVVERPWAVDGLLGVRPLVTATLAADHRASDGHVGALYLTAFERLVQRPEEL